MGDELENYIRNNLDELDIKKPNPAVLGSILEDLKAKRNDGQNGIVIPFRLLKWAAACLLVGAFGIAWWYFNQQPPENQVTQTNMREKQPLPQPVTEQATHTDTTANVADENIALRKKTFVNKVKTEQTALFAGLYNMQSAAGRIDAVTSASGMKNIDNDVVDALVQVLNKDPNTNVRLAALDGLTRFYREAYVRKKLVASLKMQHDPVVQINLISLLTRIRELTILSDLEKIVKDQNTNKDVKDFAWSGILQLRSETN